MNIAAIGVNAKRVEQRREKKKRGRQGRENSKGERRKMEMEAVEAGRWSWKK
jgi:hypothetical protein